MFQITISCGNYINRHKNNCYVITACKKVPRRQVTNECSHYIQITSSSFTNVIFYLIKNSDLSKTINSLMKPFKAILTLKK